MRFRKRVKVFPGFYLNFSNSGISSTVGIKGASVTFSKKGTYLNTGIPGTGISFRQKIGDKEKFTNPIVNPTVNPSINLTVPQDSKIAAPVISEGEIKSAAAETLTSTTFSELKDVLIEVYYDRTELAKEIWQTKREIESAKTNYIVACVFLIGFFVKSFKNKIIEKEEYLTDIENQMANAFVNIDAHFDKSFEDNYNSLLSSYKSLLTCQVIWDITSAVQQDMKATRSAASTVITRTPVKFKFDNIDIIRSTFPALHFENKNGGDMYVYPAFVIVRNNENGFGIVDLKDFELKFSQQRFLEEERIPLDTKIVDKTWAKVNKNGTPDKRFSANYEIPIVSYGRFDIKSQSGLNESYSFSNYERAEDFASAFKSYQALL